MADDLRAELEADATIRHLQERVAIAESSAGARSKELEATIIQLRQELRTQAASAAAFRQQVTADMRCQCTGRPGQGAGAASGRDR